MSKHGVSDLDSSNVSRQELPPVHTADDGLHPGLRPAQAAPRLVESENCRQPGRSGRLHSGSTLAPLPGLAAVLPGEPVVILVAVHHVSPRHLVPNQLKEKTVLEIVSEIENFKFQKFLLTSILMYFFKVWKFHSVLTSLSIVCLAL